MDTMMSATNVTGTLIEINSRFAAISSSQFIVPLQVCEAHHVAIGEAGHKIKRLYTLQKILESECGKLSAQGKTEASEMEADLCDIVGRILRNEIIRQYPVLAHKPFVICSNWTICKEKPRTGDLFKPVGPKELATRTGDTASTRQVHLGSDLHSPA